MYLLENSKQVNLENRSWIGYLRFCSWKFKIGLSLENVPMICYLRYCTKYRFRTFNIQLFFLEVADNAKKESQLFCLFVCLFVCLFATDVALVVVSTTKSVICFIFIAVFLCAYLSISEHSFSRMDVSLFMRFLRKGCLSHWLRLNWNWWPWARSLWQNVS